jgi:hypothetical protein
MSRFRYSHIKTLTTLISLMGLATIPASHADSTETPYWYDVEVALIGYQDSEQIDHETWPEVIAKNTPASENEQPLETAPWAWIDWWNETSSNTSLYNVQKGQKSTKNLKPLGKPFQQYGPGFADKIEKFDKKSGMNIVWSQKWRQPIQSKKESTSDDNLININLVAPLNVKNAISSGEALDEIEINGQIYLYRSRFLHLVAELQVQHWRTLNDHSELDKGLTSPHSNQLQDISIIPSTSSSPTAAIDRIPLRAAIVSQSRRMRSNELHYLDHPMLGILVRVTPADYGIEPPASETP